jgi:uncharacterized protein
LKASATGIFNQRLRSDFVRNYGPTTAKSTRTLSNRKSFAMARNAQPKPPVDLELLDAYLMSASAPSSSMGLSDLDGFLTGLAVGPEAIMPSEWMPLIWGGDEPDFDTVDAANAILGTIMARYNEIIACLDTVPESFDPIFFEGPEGEVIVTDWAAGFMDAVILRNKAWTPILEDEDGRVLMLPLLVLGSDDERPLVDEAPLPEDEMESLLADGAGAIKGAVVAIYEFWQERKE